MSQAKLIRFNIASANTSGITDYYVYTRKDLDFVGTGIPSGFQAIVVPVGLEGLATYTATATGTYYYRVYSYNSEASKFSRTYLSGSVFVDDIIPIRDIGISHLRIDTTSGIITPDASKEFVTHDINPGFLWSTASLVQAVSPDNFNTRVTVRKPSVNLIPSLPILKEDIIYTSGTPTGLGFDLPFSDNYNLPGGPYRQYDLVVESIDIQGYTSAGNTTLPQELVENGWRSYPSGYDLVRINNPSISGFFLSSGTGLLTFNNSNYITNQYFDINGSINIKFSGVSFPPDLVGGKAFVSRTVFTAEDAKTGNVNVKTAEFVIDPDDNSIFAETKLNILNLKSGYCALMLFDNFDLEYKKYTNNFWTGNYISNIVGAKISGSISEFSVSNFIEFFNTSGNNNSKKKISVISTGGNSYKMISLDNSEQEIVWFTYKE